MSKNMRCYRFFAILTAVLMLLGCAACSGQKKPQAQSGGSKSQQEEKEPPKELDKLKSSIEKIEKTLKTVYEENKKPLFMQEQQAKSKGGKQQGKSGSSQGSQGSQSGGQGGGQGGQGGQSGGSQGGGQGGQQQTQQQSSEQLKQQLLQAKYAKLDSMKKDIIDLHTSWNSYEPKAISDLIQQPVIEEFETALNSLTDAVNKQDIYQSMLEVNQLKKYLPDFYTLYKTKYPPDIDRVRFAVTKIKLLTDNKDYEGASTVLTYLDTVWATAKPKLKKDNLEQMNKFDLALADLKKALASKNDTIIEAKTEVITSIMGEIEKSAKKSSK